MSNPFDWYGMVWYGMVWYGMVWYVLHALSQSALLGAAAKPRQPTWAGEPSPTEDVVQKRPVTQAGLNRRHGERHCLLYL
jgi:hypothetical protein